MDTGVPLRQGFTFPWMFGQRLDIAFYFAPVIVAWLAFALSNAPDVSRSIFWATVVSSGFGAGPFHGGPTWFVYFDRRNIAHWGSSPGKATIFFILPPALMLLSVVGMLTVPHITNAVYIFWTVQHLVQQNFGILSLYHNHGANEAVPDRVLEKASLYFSCLASTLIMVLRLNFEGLGSIPGLPLVIWTAAFAAFGANCTYIAVTVKQLRAGKSLNVPALVFWLLSVCFFLPAAFLGRTGYHALLIPLVLHWFQYIGLNYVLVGRKYAGEDGANLPSSHPLALLTLVCLLTVAAVLAMNIAALADNALSVTARRMLVGAVFGLSIVHYYLDAFIWRFREPYQRQAILPYLLAGRAVSS